MRWPLLHLCARGGLGLLVMLLGAGPGHGQAPTPAILDSLTQALRRAPTDSARVQLTLQLAGTYGFADTARARHYLRQALRLGQQAGYGAGEAAAWLNLASLYNWQNQPAQAHRCYGRARALFGQLYRQQPRRHLLAGLVSVASNEALLFGKEGNFTAETQANLQAAAYATQLHDTARLGSIYANLGDRFQALGQPDKALGYWQRGATLQAAARQAPDLIVAYLNIAEYYLNANQLPLAWGYLQRCAQLVQAGKAPDYVGEYEGMLGQYYRLRHAPAQAEKSYLQALRYIRQRHDNTSEATLLTGLGRAELALAHYGLARHYLAQSLHFSPQLPDIAQQAETLAALAEVEERDHNLPLALRYYRQAHHLQDSLAATASKMQINVLENQYQTRQQAQHIRSLEQAQRLQRAELGRQRARSLLYLALLGLLGLLAAGAYLALRQRQQRQQRHIASLHQERQLLATEAMLRGQEEERGRLARDLHDGLGGMLSTVKLYLGSARNHLVLNPESARLFTRSLEHLDSSIQEMRRVARDLMPEALLTFGLPAAVQDLCETLQHGQPPLRVQCQAFGLETRLPPRTELVLYRLVQELLNNVLKHAQAQQVIVQLTRHEQLVQLVVEDDGRGFDPAARPRPAGVGLRSVQARVDYLGGTLEVQSQPGQGTCVTIDFHLTA